MIGLFLPAVIAIAAILAEHFQRGELEDRGTQLVGLAVGLALTYGHRFLRPIGIDFAAVSKYIGWGLVAFCSFWLAFPKMVSV